MKEKSECSLKRLTTIALCVVVTLIFAPTASRAATLIDPSGTEAVYPALLNVSNVNLSAGSPLCLGVNSNPWNNATQHCYSGHSTVGGGGDAGSCTVTLPVGQTISSVTAWRGTDTSCTDTYQNEVVASDLSVEIVDATTTEEGTATTSTDLTPLFETGQYLLLGISMLVFLAFGWIGYLSSYNTPQS